MFEVAIKAAKENAGSGPLTAGRANAPFLGPIRTRARSHEAIYAAETALIMAEEKGSWSAVRLHDVADRLLVGQAAGKVPRPSER